MALVADPNERKRHEPGPCTGCGADLTDAPEVGVERRQMFDLPPLQVRVVEHQLIARRCGCGTTGAGCRQAAQRRRVVGRPRPSAVDQRRQALLLFLVLDVLAGSFEEQFLALDARLDEIQVELLTKSSPGTQAEILAIRRRLADAVQSLAGTPGTWTTCSPRALPSYPAWAPAPAPPRPAPPPRRPVDRRRQGVPRGGQGDARPVLGDLSGRQGQVINFLAVISAIFLPPTFIAGYFGMNFDVLTVDLNTFWIYILLGYLLPAASVVVAIVLFRRWVTHLGIPGPCRPAGRPDNRQQNLKQRRPAIQRRRHDGAAAAQSA